MEIGFIGCGNMAQAMISGIVAGGLLEPEEIMASNRSQDKLRAFGQDLKIKLARTNRQLAEEARIIVLAVKPQFYRQVLGEIGPLLGGEKILVSLAPSFSLEELGQILGQDVKIIRAMPNTPAMVGEGMTGLAKNDLVSPQEAQELEELFSSFGSCQLLAEDMMDAVVAVSGSSPAYIFMLLEALADGAVLEGMARDQAYKFAGQAVLGSAKLLLETGLHPGILKDMVCSPAGTTIEAVKVLEESGFRASILRAMAATSRKSGAGK